jgi:hypothetical protein
MSSGDVFDASQEDLDGGAGKVSSRRVILPLPGSARRDPGQEGRVVNEAVCAIAVMQDIVAADYAKLVP